MADWGVTFGQHNCCDCPLRWANTMGFHDPSLNIDRKLTEMMTYSGVNCFFWECKGDLGHIINCRPLRPHNYLSIFSWWQTIQSHFEQQIMVSRESMVSTWSQGATWRASTQFRFELGVSALSCLYQHQCCVTSTMVLWRQEENPCEDSHPVALRYHLAL